MKRSKPRIVRILLIALLAVSVVLAQQPSRDVSKESARPVRDWVRDGVIYEIYPRAFSPQGNFNAITARLDELKDLGVTILWLMPIHPIGQEKKKGTIGSPYAVRDYYAINPDYGTADDLKRLVREAHARRLKVIIDIVANHTSWDSVLMKHPEFYKHDAKGNITYPYDWSDIAALNYGNQQLRRYMTDMLKHWIREFDLDGFRCDVAGEVPTDFWEDARRELEQIKPDIVMLAEAHKAELLVRAFDLDYSWPLHTALTNVLQGRGRASDVREEWEKETKEWPKGALHMRFSDNHDERRAIARFGEPAALAASAFVFTLERRPEFPQFYKQIMVVRRGSAALRRGSLNWLRNSDEARVVTFVRRAAGEEVLVAINFSSRPFFGSVEVSDGGKFADVNGVAAGLPALSLDAWGFRIFSHR